MLPGDNLESLHAYAVKLLMAGVPMLLAGAETDVLTVRQQLVHKLGNEGLQTLDVTLHVPNPLASERYRFKTLTLTLMRTGALGFRVCHPLPSRSGRCAQYGKGPSSSQSPPLCFMRNYT